MLGSGGGEGDERAAVHDAARAVDLVAVAIVLALTAVYTGVNLYRLAHFYPLEWDLAIFSQGVHRLAHLEVPFVSIRGMNLFGDHATYVHVLLLPLVSLLGPLVGIPWLLILVQSVALAFSGLLLHRFARRRLGAREARLVLLGYLLYPALQYTWLEYYEPVNLAIPFLFGAYAAVEERRTRSALVWCLLALVCMENISATVVALGVWALLRGQRALGATLVVVPTVYVLLLLGVVFPCLEPGGYVYGHRLWGEGVRGASEIVSGLLARLASPENGTYLLALFVPAGLLPLLAPAVLALAVQMPLNMVSDWPYAREIQYHYVAPVIPFVWLAVVVALGRLSPSGAARRVAVGALVAGALVGQLVFASPWLDPRNAEGWWRGRAADRVERREIRSLLALVPEGAVVSADYRFLPHLVHHDRLFMFPDLGPSGLPDLVLLDLQRPAPSDEDARALEQVRRDLDEVARTPAATVLLRRRDYRPPAPVPAPPPGRPTAPRGRPPG